MAITIGYLEYFIGFIFFVFLPSYLYHKKTPKYMFTYWPILGMSPGMALEFRYLYTWMIDVLEYCNMTFPFSGPWLSDVNLMLTADPANTQHVLCTNFANYPKGPEFKKIFDVLGDGIFNVDAGLWEDLRTSSHSIFSSHEFQNFSTRTSMSKLKNGLFPILEDGMRKNVYVDLQDVFQRFLFDTSSILMTGHDPNYLITEMPNFDFGDAVDGVADSIFYRHFKPEFLWRFQYWAGFGIEKRMKNGLATFDKMLAKIIYAKREDIKNRGSVQVSQGEALDVLTYYMTADTVKYKYLRPESDKFVRDIVLGFLIAGRDTTSSALTWLFWSLITNPRVLHKVRDEINTKMPVFDPAELDKLVYLHSVICETLRLYPPVPFNHKEPKNPETLPSGHKVDKTWKVLISIYAMGRMKPIWGKDAEEFRPERWITDNGTLRHEPSYKFLAFNAGPRSCVGKKLSFLQMKTAAVHIIRNFDFELIPGHKTKPVPSVLLRMQHGLHVKVHKI